MPKFRLVDEYRYWWPVSVELPDPDQSGRTTKQTLELQFVPIAADEALKLDAEFRALPSAEERSAHEHDLLVRVVKNWRGVVADDDVDEPFSEAAFRRGLQFPWFRTACYRAYGQSLVGEEARLGN